MKRTTKKATKKKAKRTVARNKRGRRRVEPVLDLSNAGLRLTYSHKLEVHWSRLLEYRQACGEAVQFARKCRTIDEAIRRCPRGEWIRWLINLTVDGSKIRRHLKLDDDCCYRSLPDLKRRFKLSLPKLIAVAQRGCVYRFDALIGDVIVRSNVANEYVEYVVKMSNDLARDIGEMYGRV